MPIGTIFGTLWARFNDYQTVQSILRSDFAQNWIYPFVLPAATLASGFLQKEPLMWIIVATVWCLAGVGVSMANLMFFRERNSPLNKLSYRVIYQQDLDLASLASNRAQRRSQQARILGINEVHQDVKRNVMKGQLGIEVLNNAHFPISCFLLSSTTKIEGDSPPRSDFPKARVTINPGASIRILDDVISFDDLPCQRLSGQINMIVKYGKKGKERFELNPKGMVDIQMTEFGFVSAVVLEFKEIPIEPLPAPKPPARLRKM